MSICAPSLNEAMCSKQQRIQPCLKCQPSKILTGAEGLQSREQNGVSTEVSGNELTRMWGEVWLIEIPQK